MIAVEPAAGRPTLLPATAAATAVLMRCPHCQSTVEPARTATGDPLCPVCRNTGRPTVQGAVGPAPFQAAAAPSLPPPPPAAPVPGIAVASMVIGIVGVLFLFTVFLAPVSFL